MLVFLLPALSGQTLNPPERWDLDWHVPAATEFEIRSQYERSSRLLPDHHRLPWALHVDGLVVSYGDAALDALEHSPPRIQGRDPFADDRAGNVRRLHDKLALGQPLRPPEARSIAAWLLETGAVSVQAPNGRFVRTVRVLEYSYRCVNTGGCSASIRAFYLPGGRIWFWQFDWLS